MAGLVTRTPRATEPHFHLPEPPRGGQDPGPGQDLRHFPRQGATSKIQHGNQSAGIVPMPSYSPQREQGIEGSSPLRLSCGGCSLCCPMLLSQKASCGCMCIPATPMEMGTWLAPALCKGPWCGTPLTGRSLATAPRVTLALPQGEEL